MKIKTITLAIVAASSLAACGEKNIGVSAGTTSTSSTSNDSALSRVWSIVSGQELKATATMPASFLIAEALVDETTNPRLMLQALAQIEDLPRKITEPKTDEALKQRYEEAKAEIEKYSTSTDPKIQALVNEAKGAPQYTLVAEGKMQEARDLESHRVNRALALLATAPVRGWYRGTNDALFARQYGAACLFANSVFAKLTERIGPRVMRDPDAAKAEILAAFNKIPLADLESWRETAIADADKGVVSIDQTGHAEGAGFQIGSMRFDGRPAGCKIIKSGAVLLGDGYINGKKIDISLASSVSTTAERSKKIESKSTTGSDAKTGADVSVK